jgi:hypothetical protein
MPNVRLKSVPTQDQLNQVVTPIAPGQPEGIAWTFYDTQTYTSGTTTSLDFFQSIQSDKVLGNIQAQGQIPNPQFFQIYHIGVQPVLGPTARATALGASIVGSLNDMVNFLNGKVELIIADKVYHQTKISLCPWGGGPEAYIAAQGSSAGADGNQYQYARNGMADIRNRNCFWGTLIIPPTQNFRINLSWTSAITVNFGNPVIQVAMDGYLFRRVL